MEIFACVLSFVNGAVLAALACLHFCGAQKGRPDENAARKDDPRVAVQWDNLLNYAGSARGQREIEGRRDDEGGDLF